MDPFLHYARLNLEVADDVAKLVGSIVVKSQLGFTENLAPGGELSSTLVTPREVNTISHRLVLFSCSLQSSLHWRNFLRQALAQKSGLPAIYAIIQFATLGKSDHPF